jgi:biopolymer transport protein ExbD
MAKKSIEIPEASIDMTPMIDVVFNLLIFFMLVNQMVSIERAELALPLADQAQEEQDIEASKTQLVVNIHKEGYYEISGERQDQKKLETTIKNEATAMGKDKTGASKLKVLIRADRDLQFEYIRALLAICAYNNVFQISFGATIEDK